MYRTVILTFLPGSALLPERVRVLVPEKFPHENEEAARKAVRAIKRGKGLSFKYYDDHPEAITYDWEPVKVEARAEQFQLAFA